LAAAIVFVVGFVVLYFTFLAEHGVLPRVSGSLTGGAIFALAAVVVQQLPRMRPLAAFGGGVLVAVLGGPIALSVTMFVTGLQQGAGLRAFGAVIVAALGVACGWFISIPIGLVLGVFLLLVIAAIDLIPGSREAPKQ
jgi:hypothetical protein